MVSFALNSSSELIPSSLPVRARSYSSLACSSIKRAFSRRVNCVAGSSAAAGGHADANEKSKNAVSSLRQCIAIEPVIGDQKKESVKTDQQHGSSQYLWAGGFHRHLVSAEFR